MNAADIAKRIPDRVRSERLMTEADPIASAIPVASNYHMLLLIEVWHTYIEPHKPRGICPVCLDNILKGFRSMKPALLELEKQYQLLNRL